MTQRQIILILIAVNIGLLATMVLMIYWFKTSPERTYVDVNRPVPIGNTVTQISVRKFNATNLLAQLADRKIGWKAIESTNYLFYINNLRSIGCPEETVRDIIIADIANLYAGRRAALRAQLDPFPYWRTVRGDDDLDAFNAGVRSELEALDKEQAELVFSLLQVDYQSQIAKYQGANQVDPFLFTFLAPEKRWRLQSLIRDFELRETQIREASGGVLLPTDRELLSRLEEEREQALAELLNPEELARYELTASPVAKEMRRDLYGFEPTQEEFQEIYRVREVFEEVLEGALENNPDIDPELRDQAFIEAERAVEEELTSLLGEERFQEYERSLDPDYQAVLKMTERLQLPEDAAGEIYSLKQSVLQQKNQILSNPRLSAEQQRVALEIILTETKASIATTLGDDTYDIYRRTGSDWLQDYSEVPLEIELISPGSQPVDLVPPRPQ